MQFLFQFTNVVVFRFGQNDRMRMPRKHDSTSSLPVIHDGKVILEPAVLQHSLVCKATPN